MYAERLETLYAERAGKVAIAEGLHQKAADEGRLLSPAEQGEFDIAASEVERLSEQITGLEKLEAVSAKSARSLIMPGYPSSQNPTARLQERGIGNLPKGTAFARYAMALAAGRGNLHASLEYARTAFGKTSPEVVSVIKAAVAAGTTTDPTWAAPLVEYQNMQEEFIDLLRPATIVGRIDGFRRVPFNVRIPRQTSGSSVGWVGEAKPKPVSKLGFDAITMPFSKIAGIVAITEELARFSSPSAEALVRSDLVETIATFIDVQFIDPSVVANPAANSPASITNGTQTIPSSGSTFAQIDADLTAAISYMAGQQLPLRGLYWIMSSRTRIALENLRTSQDELAYPTLSTTGMLKGLAVVDSNSVPLAADDTTFIALIAPGEILLADDGGVTLDASREASIAMSDDGTGTLVSLWQNNLVGLRAERYIHWMRRRDGGVVVLSGIAY
ncbi:phage major capsid protein [Cupriavidus sp.]|uniref:phage major capsid protein n=1 Tax=Cupriavidus sp. TaxID=1873897 RepID=UPI0028BD16ED|nr:phage major capsid protein [Cupriavidus sp.]